MYLVISLLVLRAGYGIWLYQFLIIAYLFTLKLEVMKLEVRSDEVRSSKLEVFEIRSKKSVEVRN